MYSISCFVARCLLLTVVLSAFSMAQQWEVGVGGGGSLYLSNSVSAASTAGEVGFARGYAASAWLGHNQVGRLGGEVRYGFQRNEMKLTSDGKSYTFGGYSHLIHYDLLIHANSREDRVRPFVAVGGGMKGFFGTGAERAVQPLSNLAILSHTSEWKPLLSVGGGVKWAVSRRMVLRAEVRDYITPVPTGVILPSPGASINGWIHAITPMFSISYLFD